MTGLFVVLESPDGAGKSTQARRLVATLLASGRAAALEVEPTSGPTGRLIREMTGAGARPDGKTLALLFAADRQEHSRHIRTLLDAGVIVVCDRYALSTAVYQGAVSGAPEVERWADALSRFACPPDLTLVLETPIEVCAEQLRSRGEAGGLLRAGGDAAPGPRGVSARGGVPVGQHGGAHRRNRHARRGGGSGARGGGAEARVMGHRRLQIGSLLSWRLRSARDRVAIPHDNTATAPGRRAPMEAR